MSPKCFGEQIERLKDVFGPQKYSPERVKALFQALKEQKVTDKTFELIVSDCILNLKSPPLLKEFLDGLQKLEDEAKERARMASGPSDYRGALDQYWHDDMLADKDFVKACMKNLDLFMGGRISKEQFFSNCRDMDRMADQLNPPAKRGRGDWGTRGSD